MNRSLSDFVIFARRNLRRLQITENTGVSSEFARNTQSIKNSVFRVFYPSTVF